ncbi:hypothetical protein ACHAWT_004201 [Skeletonema menzelii]
MHRLLGNRGKPDDDDGVAMDYNECVAEIKKENPYIGHLALQQEAMKRIAQRRAAKQTNDQNRREDFSPQKISFRRKPGIKKNNESNSPSQSLSRSFIGFLSASTNTVKTSNKAFASESHDSSNHSHNLVMAGRRTSTYNEEDIAHAVTVTHDMRDIELSDSDEDDTSRLSSLSRKLSSLRGKMTRRRSSVGRRASTNSSISTLQRHSSDISRDSIEKSESATDDDSKPQHTPQTNSDNAKDSGEKEEEEIMDFVAKFLAKGGTVEPGQASVAKAGSRRASLFSVEENKSFEGESVSRSIRSLGEGSSSYVAADDSLICGWGRASLNDSGLMGGGGEDLICNWDSRQSVLSNLSTVSTPDVSSERKLPREIKVGSNPDDR